MIDHSIKTIGLYIHIPYCQSICHYCDFAKTGRWDLEQVQRYMSCLEEEAKWWRDLWLMPQNIKLSSINFGGGTPGLFAEEYKNLLTILKPACLSECEISIEANPTNCSQDRLEIWQALGFNRLSIGVQTFLEDGLSFLKRDHSSYEAIEAVTRALKVIPNTNLDLIYGWSKQTLADWQHDLTETIRLAPAHVSLYNLTYAAKTPIGRAQQRGRLKTSTDDHLADIYEIACDLLGAQGYHHDEVSNWAKPGFSCQHNWLYWQQSYYIGMGLGAWGYLPFGSVGRRYCLDSRLPRFMENHTQSTVSHLLQSKIQPNNAPPADLMIESRTANDWLIEYVGCGLRTSQGIALDRITSTTGHKWLPNINIQRGLETRQLTLNKQRTLHLDPKEWFRESAWALEVLDSLQIIQTEFT